MRAPAPPQAVVPVLAAAAGVVLAHAAGYALAVPSAAERGPHLEATGHGYWPLAVSAATVAAVAAMVLAAAGGARERMTRWPSLATGQAVAFAVVEVGERVVTGVGPAQLAASPEFWLGLALQVPVAVLAGRLLASAERAGAWVSAALARRRPGRATGAGAHGRAPLARPVPAAVRAQARPRAPPSLVV